VHGRRRQIEGVIRRILCQELTGLLQHALLIKQQAAAAADGDDNDDDVDDVDATVSRLSSCANDLLCTVRYYQAGGTAHPVAVLFQLALTTIEILASPNLRYIQ